MAPFIPLCVCVTGQEHKGYAVLGFEKCRLGRGGVKAGEKAMVEVKGREVRVGVARLRIMD